MKPSPNKLIATGIILILILVSICLTLIIEVNNYNPNRNVCGKIIDVVDKNDIRDRPAQQLVVEYPDNKKDTFVLFVSGHRLNKGDKYCK